MSGFHYMRFVIPLLCVCFVSVGQAEEKISQIPRCPVQIAVLRDGGSFVIEIPASGNRPAIKIVEDRARNTKTPGEYYVYDGLQSGPMKVRDVLAAFDQAQTVLVTKYGKDRLFEVLMNPWFVGENITQEEYVRRISEPEFMERIDLSEILVRIQAYRRRHGSEEDDSSKSER